MNATSATEFSFETIFTPEIVANPYPLYRQLRETSPALPLPEHNLLVLSSYEHCQAAVRHRQLGHIEDPRMTEEQLAQRRANPAIDSLQHMMLFQNPPDHTRLRGLVVKAFDARRVEAMRARVTAIAENLVAAFVDRGQGDLVSPVPAPAAGHRDLRHAGHSGAGPVRVHCGRPGARPADRPDAHDA